MFDVVKAIQNLALELGVSFEFNANVNKIVVENGNAVALIVNNSRVEADVILSGADYNHSETLLDSEYRMYSENIGTVVFLPLHPSYSILVLTKN